MKNKELIAQLISLDPEAQIEINVDINRSNTGAEVRSTRRIVECSMRIGKTGKYIVMLCDGNLRPAEEDALDNGLYNRDYDAFQAHWNGCDRVVRTEMLKKAELPSAGISMNTPREQLWEELDLRIQQMVLVRCNLSVSIYMERADALL